MLSAIITGFVIFATKIAPILASCLITVTYLPQIWRSTKTKNVDGIALWFWILLNLFLVCMVCNAVGLLLLNGMGAIGYLITEIINFSFGFWQLILVIIFGKEGRKKAKLEKKSQSKRVEKNVSL